MGKSQQAGWVSIRGKYWYGYYRETVLDPETNEERVKKIPIRLGLKTQLNKLKARNVLREQIAKLHGQVPEGRKLKDRSVSFEWFVRNRYFPVRQGDWRPETAVTKMDQIEIDLIDRFGEHPLDALDKFGLQTHLNALAGRYSQNRVEQARSYLKPIFDETIEQEYLVKDPTRKLKIPKNLRPRISRS
jgi:hypothetical protein